MPRGDRTGPMGAGAMTGRRMGICTGSAAPGYASAPGRRGSFGGGGSRRGNRNMFYATGLFGWQRANSFTAPQPASRDQEIQELKQQAEYFGNQLEAINKRIDELKEG